MGVNGVASIESCEPESSGPRDVMREGSVEAPTLCMKVAKCILWNVEEKWRARRAGLWFGGEYCRCFQVMEYIPGRQLGESKMGLETMMGELIEDTLVNASSSLLARHHLIRRNKHHGAQRCMTVWILFGQPSECVHFSDSSSSPALASYALWNTEVPSFSK